MTSYSVNHDIIQGVKVVKASLGSIVLDVFIPYPENIIAKQAFDIFVDSVYIVKCLRVHRVLEQINNIGRSESTDIIALLIFPIVIVAFVIIVIVVVRDRPVCSND